MHMAGIIIKRKDIEIEDARAMFGDVLVAQEESDWYSVDDYRERTFNGKQEITLEEFKEIFEEWLDYAENTEHGELWPFAVIHQEGYIDDYIIPHGFYEYYNQKEIRKEMLKLQVKAYKTQTMETIDDLLKFKDSEDYGVILIDYHN